MAPRKKKPTTTSTENVPVPIATPEAAATVHDNGIQTVTIQIPVGILDGNEQRRHIDIDLRPQKASILRRVADALDRQQVTLSNGQRVSNLNSTVRWLLEQIENAV